MPWRSGGCPVAIVVHTLRGIAIGLWRRASRRSDRAAARTPAAARRRAVDRPSRRSTPSIAMTSTRCPVETTVSAGTSPALMSPADRGEEQRHRAGERDEPDGQHRPPRGQRQPRRRNARGAAHAREVGEHRHRDAVSEQQADRDGHARSPRPSHPIRLTLPSRAPPATRASGTARHAVVDEQTRDRRGAPRAPGERRRERQPANGLTGGENRDEREPTGGETEEDARGRRRGRGRRRVLVTSPGDRARRPIAAAGPSSAPRARRCEGSRPTRA